MTAWSDLIKKLVKENPGTPLNTILPMAKKIYRKPDKQLNFPKPKNMTYNCSFKNSQLTHIGNINPLFLYHTFQFWM